MTAAYILQTFGQKSIQIAKNEPLGLSFFGTDDTLWEEERNETNSQKKTRG